MTGAPVVRTFRRRSLPCRTLTANLMWSAATYPSFRPEYILSLSKGLIPGPHSSSRPKRRDQWGDSANDIFTGCGHCAFSEILNQVQNDNGRRSKGPKPAILSPPALRPPAPRSSRGHPSANARTVPNGLPRGARAIAQRRRSARRFTKGRGAITPALPPLPDRVYPDGNRERDQWAKHEDHSIQPTPVLLISSAFTRRFPFRRGRALAIIRPNNPAMAMR